MLTLNYIKTYCLRASARTLRLWLRAILNFALEYAMHTESQTIVRVIVISEWLTAEL